jgi:hypothetical protein
MLPPPTCKLPAPSLSALLSSVVVAVVITTQHVALGYNMSVPLTRQVCEALAAPQQVSGVSDAVTRPDDPLTQREHCSLCNIIVQNSRRWSTTTGDLRRLCTGVPPHAQRFCMYYACKLFLFCPYFYQRDAPANRGAPCNVSQARFNSPTTIAQSLSACDRLRRRIFLLSCALPRVRRLLRLLDATRHCSPRVVLARFSLPCRAVPFFSFFFLLQGSALGVAPLAPCPAKYICSYCLDIPTFQTFGCFDGLAL